MKRSPSSTGNQAQTLVFFTLAIGLIIILCGFAIDSGLLYLAKARLSRAVDGAALAAVGNFSQGQLRVAKIMRDFAVVNFTDLGVISTTAVAQPGHVTNTKGQLVDTYTYNFNDGQKDANGQYKRFVEVVLQLGTGGQITSATCNARCPVRTYFMGVAGPFFRDMKVSSSAVATRNPRLIMVVVDRSASMLSLKTGRGAFGLPQAIVTFLNFFDTTSDNIGLVSFSSNARLEMPLTTNFLYGATNILTGSYDTNLDNSGNGIPRADPEDGVVPGYATNGVRRLKFGGSTAPDEGIRMAMEQLMANPGFTNPDVLKYLVLFTDGAWNCVRTLIAAPGYTNVINYPVDYGTNLIASAISNAPSYNSNSVALPVPTLSPYPDMSNAQFGTPPYYDEFDADNHLNDVWQSLDGSVNEPLPLPHAAGPVVEGHVMTVVGNNFIGAFDSGKAIDTTTLNVWLQPGAVDYVYATGNPTPVATYYSDLRDPGKTVTFDLLPGQSNVLVVPGYLADGAFTDSLDLSYPAFDDYPAYRYDAFLSPYTWPDVHNTPSTLGTPDAEFTSEFRKLMFRNYANLLTGYYIYRIDDPLGTGVEPIIQDYTTTAGYPTGGYPRALHGLGPYYPSAGFYWPFDLVGIDFANNFALVNALIDPSGTNDLSCRHISYSINMLSPDAAPNFTGELFYHGTNSDTSGTNVASYLMATKADWQSGIPDYIKDSFDNATCTTTNQPTHNSNINAVVWRPLSYNGSNDIVNQSDIRMDDPDNKTGGYVYDGTNFYRNAMAYSGRPTHYYNFATSTWVPFTHNHDIDPGNGGYEAFPLCVWKVKEYAWHARAMGVTIYTVGYGTKVSLDEQILLAQVANATNSTADPSTNIPFNQQQPIGQQFYAQTVDDISNDFYQIGQAINESLTQ